MIAKKLQEVLLVDLLLWCQQDCALLPLVLTGEVFDLYALIQFP
jgi:hypothetical protein